MYTVQCTLYSLIDHFEYTHSLGMIRVVLSREGVVMDYDPEVQQGLVYPLDVHGVSCE